MANPSPYDGRDSSMENAQRSDNVPLSTAYVLRFGRRLASYVECEP